MNSSSPVVRRATSSDAAAGAATLAGAFATDPVMNWLIGPKADVESRLRLLFDRSLGAELAKPSHVVDIAASGRGVALWREMDGVSEAKSNLRRRLSTAYRVFGWRLPQALRVLSMIEAAHPTTPHRYLAFIGVDPSAQGTGLGSALLSSAIEELDERGTPAYLESSNPVNDPLYHRFGFETTGQIPLPGGAPPVAAMWRDPR